MNANEKRTEIVGEALSWITGKNGDLVYPGVFPTRYEIRGMVKGGGCDCGSLLMAIAINCQLIEPEQMEVYSADCWAHWRDDKYLRRVMKSTVKVLEGIAYRSTKILPGSLVLSRAAGCSFYNHGGIVTRWPKIVHAVTPAVEEVDATADSLWAYREIAVFEFNALKLCTPDPPESSR